LFSTEILRTLYISLLSHPDRTLQKAALNCVFTYKSSHLASHEDKIRILLDDTRWRDELASLDFDLIEPQDRREVVDVILRLLFGVMLEKRGRSRGADRRAAVLGTLGGCTNKELGLLVDLMLQPLGSTCTARREQPFTVVMVDPGVSDKQQIGFLTLLGDVLRNLGPRLVDYWPALLGTTIDLVASTQTRVESPSGHEEEEAEEVGEGEGGEETGEDMGGPTSSSKTVRSIRQLGLKRFANFFRCPMSFDYSPYMEAVFTTFISPRLSALDKENTQAPSALMELFYSWSLEEAYTGFLVQYDSRVLPKVYDCLVAPSVKPAVVSRIFDIVESLLAASFDNRGICDTVVQPHISLLLSNLSALVERMKDVSTVATPMAHRQINILSEIAQYCTDASQASTLFGLFAPLLRKPPKLVPEKVKADLLKIFGQLMPLIPGLSDRASDVYQIKIRLIHTLR
jgi:U3 small nucleolar RNA-associated protein 20